MNKFSINKIKLIVGLGNIGKKYLTTRHNAGFLFLEFFSDFDFQEEKKFKAGLQALEIEIRSRVEGEGGETLRILLAKPTTMMNLSGDAVNLIKNYFKLSNEQILIAHDDLDIALGEYKLQFNKGPKEHNGISSVEQRISGQDFWRLRIGIDNRTDLERRRIEGMDYVLGNFSNKELRTLDQVFDKIVNDII